MTRPRAAASRLTSSWRGTSSGRVLGDPAAVEGATDDTLEETPYGIVILQARSACRDPLAPPRHARRKADPDTLRVRDDNLAEHERRELLERGHLGVGLTGDGIAADEPGIGHERVHGVAHGEVGR